MPRTLSNKPTAQVVCIHLILAKLRTLYATLKIAKDIQSFDYQVRRTSCFFDVLLVQTVYAQLRSYADIPPLHEREFDNKICSLIRSIVEFYRIPGFFDFSNPDINPLPILDPALTYGQNSHIAARPVQTTSSVQHTQSNDGIQYQRIHHSPIRMSDYQVYYQEPYSQLSQQPELVDQSIPSTYGDPEQSTQ